MERGAKTSGAARQRKVDGGARKWGRAGLEARGLLAILLPLNNAFNLWEDL